MQNKYNALGIMSGTSHDGVDLVFAEFTNIDFNWSFKIHRSECIAYSDEMKMKLQTAPSLHSEDLINLDHNYGQILGKICMEFLTECDIKPDLIASHGHTIFHRPEKGFSHQIGNGNDIAAITSLPVVYDFRSLDVSKGGHGAPLVPAGDIYLFNDYSVCLNLGGFSNLSFSRNNEIIAYDICPVNNILNSLSADFGYSYDKDGELGKKGKSDQLLLNSLDSIPFYNSVPPRSLGKEFMDKWFLPTIKKYDTNLQDTLHTCYEHISSQISHHLNMAPGKNVLITGGGTYNDYLIELIRQKTNKEIVIPSEIIIKFKEALIFAFLGVLRWEKSVNCFASVTGASEDSSTGIIVNP